MPSLSARLLALLLLAALAAGTGAAWAQDRGRGQGQGQGRDRDRDDGHDRHEGHRALSDAVRRVERESGGGQVLSAERVPFDGRDVSRVKVVDPSGRVRVYMDDPQQGRNRRDDGRTRGDDNDND
ncbi:hypothetical protein [Lysobacter silvisoli]|uniref:hypothetical protein n=1 Tax=Lysobacter silvisoli TaxID=2293254 RepID=UPI0026CACC90